jgi:hypothetical protein
MHEGLVHRGLRSEQQGQARHALLADHADFDAVIGPGAYHQRCQSAPQEIDMLDRAIAAFQLAANRKVYGGQVGPQDGEVGRRKAAQKAVRQGFVPGVQNAQSSVGARMPRWPAHFLDARGR